MTLPEPPILLITARRLAPRPLQEVIEAALHAGCRWLLAREKDLSSDALLGIVDSAARSAHACGARVLVSADIAVAARAGADGVHLPRNMARPDVIKQARAALGPSALVGVSAHDRSEAEQAAEHGADYVTLSPIFPSASKPGYGPALGPAGLSEAVSHLDIPVVALGGVAAENAALCRTAGAAGIAVMGGIMRAERPDEAMRALIRSWSRPRKS